MEKVTTSKPLTGKRILIVEDDHFISRIYEKWLTAAGASILIAHDGVQGLRTLDEEKVDLVLLDLGMPGLDGYEMLNEIRKRSGLEELPVIILSNTTMTENREGFDEIKKAGVKDVLRKYETSLTEIVECISAYFPKEVMKENV